MATLAQSTADAPLLDGDEQFLGVQMRGHPASLAPGWVSEAVNCRFRNGIVEGRLGSVRMNWLNNIVDVAADLYYIDGAILLPAGNGSYYLLRCVTYLGVTSLDVDQSPTTPPSFEIPEDIVFTISTGSERLYLYQDPTDLRIYWGHEPTTRPGTDAVALRSNDGNDYNAFMSEGGGSTFVDVNQTPNP